jgi:uroporphyrinogen-III synthase
MATPSIYLLSTAALSAELVEEAAAKGIVIDTVNFIAIEMVIDAEMSARIKALGDLRLTAVFTSVNAVNAVKRWMGGVPDWRIFCIGGATRRAVVDYFGEMAIAGAAEAAEALAEEMTREGAADARSGSSGVGQDRNGRAEAGDLNEIFFFCGDQRREELPAILRGEGFTVNEWIVYRTMLTPRKTQRAYAGIAFFSPSAVESYFSLNTPAGDVTLFAIGRTTAAAIQARCSYPVIIGDRPGKDALVRTMTDHFQTNNKE